MAAIMESVWESFHNRICKNIIEHKGASNIATLSEMDSYLISIEIHKGMIKYLLRFKTMEKDRLVYKAFLEDQNNNNTTNIWVAKTREILDRRPSPLEPRKRSLSTFPCISL